MTDASASTDPTVRCELTDGTVITTTQSNCTSVGGTVLGPPNGPTDPGGTGGSGGETAPPAE